MLFLRNIVPITATFTDAPYREHPTNVFTLTRSNVILSLRVYHRSVKLVSKYDDFIHFIASHVSAVTSYRIRSLYINENVRVKSPTPM